MGQTPQRLTGHGYRYIRPFGAGAFTAHSIRRNEMIPGALEQSRQANSLGRLMVTVIMSALLIALGVIVARASCAEYAEFTRVTAVMGR
jgi:hypothetical protein